MGCDGIAREVVAVRAGTAALAVVLTGGLVAGIGSAARATTTDDHLRYSCDFTASTAGSGNAIVDVTVTATFPVRATIDNPFRPTGVSTTVTVPRSALPADVVTVAASTRLAVAVAQRNRSADADWLGTADAVPVPDGGTVTLVAPGEVPAVTVTGGGAVSFAASDLRLTLHPYAPDGPAGKDVSASCTPRPGQRTTLGSVRVPGDASASTLPSAPASPSEVPTASGGAARSPATALPGGTAGSKARAPLVAPPKTSDKTIDRAPYQACVAAMAKRKNLQPQATYLTGYANLGKLHAAAYVGFPTLGVVESGAGEGLASGGALPGGPKGHYYFCARYTGQLDDNGDRALPPMTATVSAFGFMPVSATAHLSQIGDEPVTATMYQDQGVLGRRDHFAPYAIVATTRVTMRLSNVRVNGVLLDVGDHCRVSRPLYTPNSLADPANDRVVTVGGDKPGDPLPLYTTPNYGGASAGAVTIPPFTGCVTPSGDDLDALLTATVSGGGNYAKLVQGALCPSSFETGCPPDRVAEPGKLKPVWTITHGGRFIATGPMQFRLHAFGVPMTVINCQAATLSGAAYNMHGPVRGDQARIRVTKAVGCTGSRGTTWTVRQNSSGGFDGLKYNASTGLTKGRIADAKLQLIQTSPRRCSATVIGPFGMTYSDATGSFALVNISLLGTGETSRVAASSCPDIPEPEPSARTLRYTQVIVSGGPYTLPPDQAFTLTSP